MRRYVDPFDPHGVAARSQPTTGTAPLNPPGNSDPGPVVEPQSARSRASRWLGGKTALKIAGIAVGIVVVGGAVLNWFVGSGPAPAPKPSNPRNNLPTELPVGDGSAGTVSQQNVMLEGDPQNYRVSVAMRPNQSGGTQLSSEIQTVGADGKDEPGLFGPHYSTKAITVEKLGDNGNVVSTVTKVCPDTPENTNQWGNDKCLFSNVDNVSRGGTYNVTATFKNDDAPDVVVSGLNVSINDFDFG